MLAQTRYTRTAIALHWLIALLMATNIALILLVDHYPDDWVRPAVDTHKSIGITVLGLVLLRILWRATHKPPAMPGSFGALERFGAHAAHGALYVLMVLLPLSGWMHDSAWKDAGTHPMYLFGLFEWPRIAFVMGLPADRKEQLHGLFGAMHEIGGYLLIALLLIHIAGALKHQFIDREPEFRRMWPR